MCNCHLLVCHTLVLFCCRQQHHHLRHCPLSMSLSQRHFPAIFSQFPAIFRNQGCWRLLSVWSCDQQCVEEEPYPRLAAVFSALDHSICLGSIVHRTSAKLEVAILLLCYVHYGVFPVSDWDAGSVRQAVVIFPPSNLSCHVHNGPFHRYGKDLQVRRKLAAGTAYASRKGIAETDPEVYFDCLEPWCVLSAVVGRIFTNPDQKSRS